MTDVLGLFERAFPALDPAPIPMRLTDITHREVCSGVTQYELTLVEDRFPAFDRYYFDRPTRVRIGDTVHTITPKEAPMPYTHIDSDGDTLTIERSIDHSGADVVEAFTEDGRTIFITKEDAPRVALELLKTIGYRPSHVWTATAIESAVLFLSQHVEAEAARKAEEEKAAAEKADAAKLDEEADALRIAIYGGLDHGYPWERLGTFTKNEYRAAARKARELHGKA